MAEKLASDEVFSIEISTFSRSKTLFLWNILVSQIVRNMDKTQDLKRIKLPVRSNRKVICDLSSGSALIASSIQ